MRGIALLAIVALVAFVASSEAADALASDNLVSMPGFAMLNDKAHLAYLQAKSFAVKNTEASLLQAANDRCDKERRTAFQACASKFCQCQGSEQCETLDLGIFLETPDFALTQAKGECNAKKVHSECKAHVSKAFGACRTTYLHTKKPSHEMLMQVTDTASFVKLAGEFSKDGHAHVFEYQSAEELVQTAVDAAAAIRAGMTASGSGSAGGSADGPEPSKQEVDEEQDKTLTEEFNTMQKAESRVDRDKENVPEEEDLTHPEKHVEDSELDLALKKCTQLKADTFEFCEKEMCKYHSSCGTKDSVQQCKDHEKLVAINKKHKETSFKMARRAAELKKEKAAELKVKAPELKTKAAAKEKKWKFNAPERAAKKVESKEIDEKAKKMVDGWVPGGYKLKDNNPFKITSQRKGDRRLLSADDKVLNSEAEEAKLKGEYDAQKAAATAVKDKLNSPMCKAMSSSAFDKCQAVTERAYDLCTDELNKADSDFVASIKAAEAAKIAATAGDTSSTASVEAEGSAMPAVHTPTAVGSAAGSAPVVNAAVAATMKEVPAPVGQTVPVPKVAADVASLHENDVAAATSLGKSQIAIDQDNYPQATADAKNAVNAAEDNVGVAKDAANDDLKAVSAETGSSSSELYQQYEQLYESELVEEDDFDEVVEN